MSGKGTPAPVRVRTYSPSEFAAALNDAGVRRCERWVQARCSLPAGHQNRIDTLPAFAGRHLIPETELFRLLGIKSEVTA